MDLELSFWFALLVASAVGALQAGLLGAVSLRLSGLYFALVTLAYGAFTEQTIFGITAITGGEGGKAAPRPTGFDSELSYYLLCLGFLAVVHLAGGLFTVFQWYDVNPWQGVGSIVVSAVVLYLLFWARGTREFFAAPIEE